MDKLLKAANTYKTLLTDHKYTFIFGDKKREQHAINLDAKPEHFQHLVGLDKLKDIQSFLFKSKRKEDVFTKVMTKDITEADLEKSSFYTSDKFTESIERRIYFFPFITKLFDEGVSQDEASFIFLREKSYSKIDADYLMRYKIKDEVDKVEYYLNLFLKKDRHSDSYIPMSFFPRKDRDYEKSQPRLTLLYKAEIKGNVEKELFKRNNFHKAPSSKQ